MGICGSTPRSISQPSGCRLHSDDDGVICVDQIVGCIGEHGFHLALVQAAAGLVSDVNFGSEGGLPGGEIGLDLTPGLTCRNRLRHRAAAARFQLHQKSDRSYVIEGGAAISGVALRTKAACSSNS